MRRIQLFMPASMDDTLEAEAARRGVSKASLIRDAVAKEFNPEPPKSNDPWQDMLGWFEDGGVDDIDEILYGPKRREP